MNCWSCNAGLPDATDLCPSCSKLQAPRAGDYFAYLGLPRGYHVDVEKLSDILREKSRRFHPDRFARADEREKTYSMQHTTLLNDAVRTLRDPQRRAEYVLSLYGLKAGANDRPGAKLDPSFLMEIMETREALAEAKQKKDAAKLDRIKSSAVAEKTSLEKQADARFTEWESKTDEKRPLEAIVSLLDRMRYFEQIVAEVEGRAEH